MKSLHRFVAFAVLSAAVLPEMLAMGLLNETPSAADFRLATDGRAAAILLETETPKIVTRAAKDFAGDVESVTGVKLLVLREPAILKPECVIVGVLGHSPLLDRLIAAGKLDVTDVSGQWESYAIQTVDVGSPGTELEFAL